MPTPPLAARPTARLRALLEGPLPSLPRAVDAVADWWAGRPPRLRMVVLCLAVLAFLAAGEARVQTAQRTWGGNPVRVLIADESVPIGAAPGRIRSVRVPPALAPPDALEAVPSETALALPLPRGAVLQAAHLSTGGPGAGLPQGLRAVPIEVEEGWGVQPGGWVDVWILGGGEEASRMAAAARPVVEIREGPPDTALIALAPDEVEEVTRGLAVGRLLLVHTAPPVP